MGYSLLLKTISDFQFAKTIDVAEIIDLCNKIPVKEISKEDQKKLFLALYDCIDNNLILEFNQKNDIIGTIFNEMQKSKSLFDKFELEWTPIKYVLCNENQSSERKKNLIEYAIKTFSIYGNDVKWNEIPSSLLNEKQENKIKNIIKIKGYLNLYADLADVEINSNLKLNEINVNDELFKQIEQAIESLKNPVKEWIIVKYGIDLNGIEKNIDQLFIHQNIKWYDDVMKLHERQFYDTLKILKRNYPKLTEIYSDYTVDKKNTVSFKNNSVEFVKSPYAYSKKNGINYRNIVTSFQDFKARNAKKIIGLSIAGAIALGVGGAITVSDIITKKEFEESVVSYSQAVDFSGFLKSEYGSINNVTNLTEVENAALGENTFTFITINDNNFDSKELKAAIDQGKNIGLIIEPTGNTYESIEKTILTVREEVNKGYIKCPIVYNIMPLMSSDFIDANCKLAKFFCDTLGQNCYISLYGDQESMNKFVNNAKETMFFENVDDYDRMLEVKSINELGNIKNANMIKLPNNIILWKHCLYDVINNNNLNSKLNVDFDEYTVAYGDDLNKIAYENNVNYFELLLYNKLTPHSEIYEGVTLKLPRFNVISKSQISNDMTNQGWNENYIKGIDVSGNQGFIDWHHAKEQGLDFAIVKMVDCWLDEDNWRFESNFLYNVQQLKEENIKFAIYYYSRAKSEEGAKKEIDWIVNKMQENGITGCTIFMDIEETSERDDQNYKQDIFHLLKSGDDGKMKDARKIVKTALNYWNEQEGFKPAIYCNPSIKKLLNLDNVSWWITSSSTYNNYMNFELFTLDDIDNEDNPTFSETPIYQYSQHGTLNVYNCEKTLNGEWVTITDNDNNPIIYDVNVDIDYADKQFIDEYFKIVEKSKTKNY